MTPRRARAALAAVAAAAPLDLTEEYGLTLAPAVPQRPFAGGGGEELPRGQSRNEGAVPRDSAAAQARGGGGDGRAAPRGGTDRRGGWRASKARATAATAGTRTGCCRAWRSRGATRSTPKF